MYLDFKSKLIHRVGLSLKLKEIKMFSIDRIKCPSCKSSITDDFMPDNLEIIKSSFEETLIVFKCYKCDYQITAKPTTKIEFDDVE